MSDKIMTDAELEVIEATLVRPAPEALVFGIIGALVAALRAERAKIAAVRAELVRDEVAPVERPGSLRFPRFPFPAHYAYRVLEILDAQDAHKDVANLHDSAKIDTAGSTGSNAVPASDGNEPGFAQDAQGDGSCRDHNLQACPACAERKL